MSKIIEIYDPVNDKMRTVKNLKKQTYTAPDENGVEVGQDFVDCVVIGRNKEWKLSIPFRQFKKHNIKLLNEIT